MSSWVPPNNSYPPPKPGEPPLHRAARLGDHEQIRALVEAGADVDEVFEIQLDPGARREPATPLMVAAGSSDGATGATVHLLLDLGASIELAGLSALPYACMGLGWNYPPGGDAERVAALLAARADPAATAKNDASALACAARSGNPGRVRLLLEAGADPMPDCVKEIDGYRVFLGFRDPLLMAAESGSAACVRLLLDAGADLRHYPKDEERPVFAARSLEVVELLLAVGGVPSQDEEERFGVVESVATNSDIPVDERVEMLKALAAAGMDLDHRTPLFGAAMNADDDAVYALLQAGADPLREPTGLTGICFAAMRGPNPSVDRVITLLVAAGLDPEEPDAAGLSPLHAAMAPDQYGLGYAESDGFNEPVALALIRAGVSFDITYPENGYRPLHAAAAAGSVPVIAALLEVGADPSERTAEGKTPLDVAREVNAGDCVRLLERASPSRL